MKILNNKKTHFMQSNTVGVYNVKFGTVNEVRAVIDTILDGKKDKETEHQSRKTAVELTDKSNH